MIKEIVFVWYETVEDFEKVKSISADAHNLDNSFEQWLKSAETGVKEMSKRGHIVKRININPDELLAWSKKRGLEINGKTRNNFASWVHMQRGKG